MLKSFLTPKSLWSYNPLPTGCRLYLPLWHPNLHGAKFKSVDPFGHECTRTGGVMDGHGITMDGNDKIQLPDNAFDSLSIGSIGIWFRIDDTATDDVLFALGNSAGATPYFFIKIDSAEKLDIEFQATFVALTNNAALSTTAFTRMIWAVTATGNALYINGSAVTPDYGSGDATNSDFFSDLAGTTDKYAIGVLDRSVPYGYSNGQIGEVSIWDYGVTAEQAAYDFSVSKRLFV